MVSRYLLFRSPLRSLLCGYCFEGSLDPNAFYVWAFVQPLFVPDESVTFLIGDRLGGICGKQEERWMLTDDNEESVMKHVFELMRVEGPVILDKFKTLEDFIKNAIDRNTNPYSPYPPEMVAYGAVLLGKDRLANKMFDRLEKTLRDAKHHRDYHDEILERARRVRNAFARSQGEAVAILDRWRDETAANLKLTKFLDLPSELPTT